jgi:hypothetical protein
LTGWLRVPNHSGQARQQGRCFWLVLMLCAKNSAWLTTDMNFILFIMLLSQLTPAQKYERMKWGQHARHSLMTFCRLTTPTPLDTLNPRLSKFQWMPHHKLTAEALQKVEAGELLNLEIEMPPRYGKTEVSVRNFVPWYAGKHSDHDLLIITATQELANEHGRDCRNYFNSSGYLLAFGGNPAARLRDDSQGMNRLQLAGGAKIQFYGRGGIPSGVGGFGIIFDDFFKSAEEAYSQTERDTAWRCYVADCLSRLNNSRSWKVIIGSRKHEDDAQGRLFDPTNQHFDAKTAAAFTRIRIPALSEGAGDPLGRAKDEVCWPDKFPKQFYLDKRNHKSDIVRIEFDVQDQCNPQAQEGTWFKADWLLTYKRVDLPKQLRIYVASDHAYRVKEKNDSTCLLVVGMDPTGTIYVLPQTYWDKCETDVLVNEMFKIVNALHPAQWWAARDAISGSLAPFIRKRQLDERVFFPLDDSITEGRDLVARSSSIRGLMAMKMVLWPEEWPKWNEARQQLISFPGKKDDLVAALAMLGMGMDRMVKAEGAKGSDIPKCGTFAWHSFGQQKPAPTGGAFV